MEWEGLDDARLYAALNDCAKNGSRDLPALVEHMTQDPLVQWAWSPGSRSLPPLTQTAFHDAVHR
jgi:hypothetical protein